MKKSLHLLSFFVLLIFVSLAANAQERVDPDPTYRERERQEKIEAEEEIRNEEERVRAEEEAELKALRRDPARDKARNEMKKKAKQNEYIKLKKSFASFTDATGWTRCSPKPIWVDMKNTICEFDNFDHLDFGWTSYDDSSYLYFNKVNSFHYTWRNSKSGKIFTEERPSNKIYVINYDEYRKQVEQLSDIDNVIMLPVIQYGTSGNTTPISKIYMGNKSIEKSDNKLIIKFRINKEKNIVRFLTYYTGGQRVSYAKSFQAREYNLGFVDQMEAVLNPLVGVSPFQDIIQSDALYENFYYETPADKFLEFIKAPLANRN